MSGMSYECEISKKTSFADEQFYTRHCLDPGNVVFQIANTGKM